MRKHVAWRNIYYKFTGAKRIIMAPFFFKRKGIKLGYTVESVSKAPQSSAGTPMGIYISARRLRKARLIAIK